MPAANVAVWTGTRWTALGAGLNGRVNALTVFNGTLYAGGAFSTPGDDVADGRSQVGHGQPYPATRRSHPAADSTPGPQTSTHFTPVTAFTDRYLVIGGGFSHNNGAPAAGLVLFDVTKPAYLLIPPDSGNIPGLGATGTILTSYVDGTMLTWVDPSTSQVGIRPPTSRQ